jgi:hypothetical protein
MRFIQFVYNQTHGYMGKGLSDYGYQMLGMFLLGDVGADEKFFKNWALDRESTRSGGNLVWLRKENNDIIVYFSPIMDVTDEQRIDWILQNHPLECDDDLPIPKKDFIHIIENWVKFRKYVCKEIWIKNEGDIYWVEGVDPLPSKK